jgi:siroheme synthase-like protein
MTHALLPLFVDLEDQTVLLVGGGRVALEKLRTLGASGCRLRLVATRFSLDFQAQARAQGAVLMKRPFREEDLDGVGLVVTATGAPGVNAAVAALARRRGLWVNAVDDAASCNALFASTLRRGPWTLALSTGGAFAGLSRSLRLVLEEVLPPDDGDLLGQLVDLRARLRTRLPDPGARSAALRGLLRQFEQRYFGLHQGQTP